RRKLADEDVVLQLAALRARQVELRDAIDNEVRQLLADSGKIYRRYFLTHIPAPSGLELLWGLAVDVLGRSLTRPQLERTLLAIKTARSGTEFPFGSARIRIDKKDFSLSVNASEKVV